MHRQRSIFVVDWANQIIAFESQVDAEGFAKTMPNSTWRETPLYLAGFKPTTWAVHTGEVSVSGIGLIEGPVFDAYMTSEVEGAPHESEACHLIMGLHGDGLYARAMGTDRVLVEKRLAEWADEHASHITG